MISQAFQSESIKMRNKKFHFFDRNKLEFFCVPRLSDYFSDLHEKFQVTFPYDIDLTYQIWTFYYDLIFSYINERHTYAHTDPPLKT